MRLKEKGERWKEWARKIREKPPIFLLPLFHSLDRAYGACTSPMRGIENEEGLLSTALSLPGDSFVGLECSPFHRFVGGSSLRPEKEASLSSRVRSFDEVLVQTRNLMVLRNLMIPISLTREKEVSATYVHTR